MIFLFKFKKILTTKLKNQAIIFATNKANYKQEKLKQAI